jgi:hypothetical protein
MANPITLSVSRADVAVLLDAIEGAFQDFDIMESCDDTNCVACNAKKESLVRVRDSLLVLSPLKKQAKSK